MRRSALALLVCLVFPACSVSNGHPLSDAQINQFSPGRSTVAEVQAQLGSPTNTTRNSDGSTMMVYQWGTNTASGQNYVPIVGPFIAKTNYVGATVTYVFAPNGVLQSFKKEDQTQAQGVGT